MLHFTTWILAAFAAASARPPVTYPAQIFSAKGVRRIVVSGARGRVVVRGRANANYSLKVGHVGQTHGQDDWGLSVERRGDTLVLEVFSTAIGREWATLLERDRSGTERWPTFDLELNGPAVPVVIGWREGEVDVAAWPAAIDATLLSGRVTVNATAKLNLQLGRGTAAITNVAGGARVLGENGRLTMDDVRGPSTVDWFSGSIELRGIRGDLNLSANDAAVNAFDGGGIWALDVRRGRARVAGFSGVLNGRRYSLATRVDVAMTY